MKKLVNFLKKYKFVLILLFISLISHIEWFNFFNILSFADWLYWSDDAVRELHNSYSTWINFLNLGDVNTQLFFNFFTFIWSIFSKMGMSYDVVVKITFLIPIAILGFVSPYIFIKKIIKHEFISFICALFYGSISYFLIRQTGHIPIAALYSLLPLIFYFFIVALESNKLRNWLFFVLLSFVGVCYEVRIMYIIYFVLFLYFIFFHINSFVIRLKNIIIAIFIFIFINLFWLLPIFLGGGNVEVKQLADRGLFGSFLFNMRSALTIHDSAWTGRYPDMNFIPQPIQFYFWFVPIIIFSVFLFLKKDTKYKREIIFFGIISLIGIFLTKQEAEPFSKVYSWLYNNFPGFNLFREASKFFIVSAIGYTGLLSFGLLSLKENKTKIFGKYFFYSFSIIILGISLWNLKPLIMRDMGSMFIPRHISNDYLILKGFILNQKAFFRTYWTPRDSRWGIYVNDHPKVSNIDIIQSNWAQYIGDEPMSIEKQIIDIYKKDFSNQLFDDSSIKYVIVPLQDKENDDDFFVYYGGQENSFIRQWYIDELNQISWLKKIDIGTKDLVIYENENYKEHIYFTTQLESIQNNIKSNNVEYKLINPTEYKINLKSIKDDIHLNFTDKYHPDWKLRVGEFNWFKVLFDKNYFISDSNHLKTDAGLNSFKVDPEYIKANFDKSYYKENPDGSIDVELTLYFKPQSYFYLGLIISGTTLLGCITYLVVSGIRNRGKETGISTQETGREN